MAPEKHLTPEQRPAASFASPPENVIACGVALIGRDRSYLIAQRKKNDSFGNYWEFPGGKKNPGETFEECAAREALEEVGMRVKVEQKLMEIQRPYNRKIIWLNFYLCTPVSGEPRPIDCQKVQWVDVAELSQYKFPPANEKVIARLMERFEKK